jgi:hypothetical protein
MSSPFAGGPAPAGFLPPDNLFRAGRRPSGDRRNSGGENPATGTALGQTYTWPADMDLAPGYDLMLRVTRTNTIPADPYTS